MCMDIYDVALTTTTVELCLTCNCLLCFEFYGIDGRKTKWVFIGIIYRILGTMLLSWLGYEFLTLNIPMEWIVDSNSTIDELLQNPFQNVRDRAQYFMYVNNFT